MPMFSGYVLRYWSATWTEKKGERKSRSLREQRRRRRASKGWSQAYETVGGRVEQEGVRHGRSGLQRPRGACERELEDEGRESTAKGRETSAMERSLAADALACKRGGERESWVRRQRGGGLLRWAAYSARGRRAGRRRRLQRRLRTRRSRTLGAASGRRPFYVVRKSLASH
jgi:hypothetical protein